ncbi:MAG: PEP/pyruvate-binding domain-containing protein [Bacillota bacterium]
MEKSCGEFFFSWPEAFGAGVGAVGGKGWNLGRLDRYGFNIPAGGVLAAGAYLNFIKENNLLEVTEKISQSVSTGNIGERDFEEKLFLIREKIKAGSISPHILEELISKLKNIGILERPLAVRSSAITEDTSGASFAGIHDSFLNILGLDNILSAIKGCYASLWTPRAVAYRRKMNVRDDEVIPAVVVMEMVEAKTAGVSFSCDPRTGRENVVAISANFGLGESVVSGAVEPDEYLLNVDYWPEITEKRIGRKQRMTIPGKQGGTEFVRPAESMAAQVLSDENIVKLGFLTLRAFEALGRGEQHQDLEWVYDGKEFFLVQARPVTALPRYICAEIKDQPDIWSNANFRDAIPVVQSTFNWSLIKHGLVTILQSPFQSVGYRIPPGQRYVRLYQGRPYFNLSLQQWLLYDALGLAPRKTNDSLGGQLPEIKINEKKSYAGVRGLKRIVRMSKFMLAISKTKRKAKESFEKFNVYTGDLLKKDFKSYSYEEFIHTIIANAKVSKEFAPLFFFLSSSAAPSYMILVNTLEKHFPGKGNAMANAIMAGRGDITSAQQGYRLVKMAEIARSDANGRRFFSAEPFNPSLWVKDLPDNSPFKQSFRNFLAEYGHRGVYEAEIINPRWREDPSYLLNIIRSTIETADAGAIKARQKEKADRAWQEIKQKLPLHRRILVKSLLKHALKGAELREMAKSVFVKLFEPGRMIYQEIGRRLAERGIIEKQVDIYHCAFIEIFSFLHGYWDGEGMAVLVAERKAGRKEMEELSPPNLIIDETPKFEKPVTCSSANILSGLRVAAGRASGPAKLIYHPDVGEKLQAGDVLVAPSTDPGWTPLFLRASAIVMETGGFLSHGAIVAREYGVPAVVNIPGVMKVIKDGQLITVDGDEGVVYL